MIRLLSTTHHHLLQARAGRGILSRPLLFAVPGNRYWLAVGAQPSDRVWYLLSKAGIVPPPPPTPRPIKPGTDAK